MFFKKQKKTKAETEKEWTEKIEKTENNLRNQILFLKKTKEILFSEILEARSKNLSVQEKQFRNRLGNCMSQIKRTEGMLMTLELAKQTRDLAEINKQFLECIGDISEDVVYAEKNTKIKKTENRYLRAMYAAEKQSEELDKMLDMGNFTAVAEADEGKYCEFDSEIDSMIEQAENDCSYSGNNRDKNRF